ncbi:hypothetical protein GGD70_007924 [Paraburkholderia fungorum]|nr:hypothetical protein [Paraburkholderia fungorum]
MQQITLLRSSPKSDMRFGHASEQLSRSGLGQQMLHLHIPAYATQWNQLPFAQG